MEGHSLISHDVLASYAADAARETAGVARLVESPLHRHRGVRVAEQEGRVTLELHLAADWSASLPDVGRAVQHRVVEYLGRMADVRPAAVNVVFDEIAS
jgi:uncharacterized alkaline shock family protein YloU